jgi:hypothetical protein
LQIRQATDGEEDRNHFWQLGKAMWNFVVNCNLQCLNLKLRA